MMRMLILTGDDLVGARYQIVHERRQLTLLLVGLQLLGLSDLVGVLDIVPKETRIDRIDDLHNIA
jgi:hypothetical protein